MSRWQIVPGRFDRSGKCSCAVVFGSPASKLRPHSGHCLLRIPRNECRHDRQYRSCIGVDPILTVLHQPNSRSRPRRISPACSPPHRQATPGRAAACPTSRLSPVPAGSFARTACRSCPGRGRAGTDRRGQNRELSGVRTSSISISSSVGLPSASSA